MAHSLSVLVPALNEERDLEATVRQLIRVVGGVCEDFEVIIVNDGSTDSTGVVAAQLARMQPRVRVLENPRNMGLGYSYARGVREAKKTHFVYVPGDNTWPEDSIGEILRHMGKADVVTSYATNPEVRVGFRRVISTAYTTTLNALFGLRMRYFNGLSVYPRQFLLTRPVTTWGFGFQAETLLKAVAVRAHAHPIPFGHWYIDGGEPAAHDPALTCVSYGRLGPARAALSEKMRSDIEHPGMGPEALRTLLARLRPADLGFTAAGDPVLDRFEVKLLTEGSGTQIFSTTFAQWAAREALRRAQPHTLLVRFAPRQRQKAMNEMLATGQEPTELDPAGSLVDADMGAYYNWLNLQRLAGAEKSSALIWFEEHKEALAIGPSLPRGTTSNATASLEQILSWAA